ncbi:alpha/beta-hydrolase [Neolentinus lepideus HHB14362 ss-1]|uniref:Alpha/beta-hydrolase n=1 Tax=Neolentinus lepideus HHB14362 ss-1 TaxID=1314782 RepID=A0A165S258_9AGAM|nr:alpha/beta-hydrolase [Neolentinus lepideus HHB14362 ss-1]
MNPSDPASFHHNIELLSTGRRYHFIDEKPVNYDAITTQTLFCIHGFPDCWFGWRFQIGPWVKQGYRVIVPDMLGYGGTDKPKEAIQYSPKRLSDDLAALLDAVQIRKAVIIGHDWGALIAGRFALWHPDRVFSWCRLPVPFTAPSKQYTPLERVVEHAPNLGYQLYFADDRFTKEIEASLTILLPLMHRTPNGGLNFTMPGALRPIVTREKEVDVDSKCILSPKVREREREYYLGQLRQMHGPLSYYRTSKIRFDEEKAANLSSSLHPDLSVLFIWGTRDPTSKALMAQKGQVAKLDEVAIEEKGHWLMVEAREMVTESVMKWLAKLTLVPQTRARM